MILDRNKTRTILNTTETTSETGSINNSLLAFQLLGSDFFYIGFKGRFASRYFDIGTVNSNSANITVEYWNGTAWTEVEDLVDQTAGFTQSGFISWLNMTDWQPREQDPIVSDGGEVLKMFYIRLSTDTSFSVGTTLESVINLYSDDDLVRNLFPEIISDDRYLPPGRTNFLEQHFEAKNRVVRRMKQKNLIEDEAQIIDINEVAEAAAWAMIIIVLSPIATSEELSLILLRAKNNFESELSRINKNVDLNEDGVVTKGEERYTNGYIFRR